MRIEQQLVSMGLDLLPPAAPVANYISAVRTGNLLFVAGHIAFQRDGTVLNAGKVGRGRREEHRVLRVLGVLSGETELAEWKTRRPCYAGRYRLTMGRRRSLPKARGVILTPGGDWRRLYSLRSTAEIT